MAAKKIFTIFTILVSTIFITSLSHSTGEDTRNILKQGLLGAGTGAIAAGTSGGKAGQGALIGAGTGVIGGALLDMLTTPSASSARRAVQPQYYDQDDYYEDEQPAEYYEPPPQESGTQKVLKQGLLGAGVGAISAGASGGSAGKGALIGAGTNVIGGVLLDAITTPSQPPPRRVYRKTPPTQQKGYTTQTSGEDTSSAPGTRKKIFRKYDDTGKVVSEEEIYY